MTHAEHIGISIFLPGLWSWRFWGESETHFLPDSRLFKVKPIIFETDHILQSFNKIYSFFGRLIHFSIANNKILISVVNFASYFVIYQTLTH